MYSYVQVMCVLSQRTDIDEAEIFAQLQNYNRAGGEIIWAGGPPLLESGHLNNVNDEGELKVS